MKCVLQIVNSIITFIYGHGFVKALWTGMEAVKSIPRAAGTRFATLHHTLKACIDNEVQLRTLFRNPELLEWLTNGAGRPHQARCEVLADCVSSDTWWRKVVVCYTVMTPFVKALRVADNGGCNLSVIGQSYFEVRTTFQDMANDAASGLEELTMISFSRL